MFTIFEGVLWPNKKNRPTTTAIAYPIPAAIIVFNVASNICGNISKAKSHLHSAFITKFYPFLLFLLPKLLTNVKKEQEKILK